MIYRRVLTVIIIACDKTCFKQIYPNAMNDLVWYDCIEETNDSGGSCNSIPNGLVTELHVCVSNSIYLFAS